MTDGQNVNYKIIPHTTKTFIAFTYSGREVKIYGTGAIPEFPPTTTFLLIIPPMLAIVFTFKKKKESLTFQTPT